ncbi:MAG: hypothetical protein JJ953_01470 [Gracilimonas sp.]|uniref:hypothetical protein n=1 Tax=Gracilimonas sp. TaxID=1974203 RepID=UPI001B2E32D1|nr:hypothetical protein [Gracilimonas sp.]MBO6584752.1 hypothetical protein [Gracilimonas sp.]MBO6615977.1 hypothetical protein [Gracilimonas sp.]
MSEFWLEIIKFGIQGIILGGAGLWVTYKYSKSQHKLAEDEFNHTLLIRFNDWYDELNDKLHDIKTLESNNQNVDLNFLRENKPELYSKLNDYLNLCAEERLWHSKGRIDPKIWSSWQAGMNYWYQKLDTLEELWEKENTTTNKDSYYLSEGEQLFIKPKN